MSVRVQVILAGAERDELKQLAREEGMSLSAWLREAGQERARLARGRRRFLSKQDLEAFFAACDEREPGQEPDWEEHLRVIERSRAEGVGEPT